VEVTRLDRLFPNHPHFRRLHLLEETPLLEPARVPVVSGAFMVIRSSRFEQLGGMDNKFFLHVDDSDLCLRVHLQGGEVWYAGNVPIVHHRSTSSISPILIEWHKTRGACYYFKKHYPRWYPFWSLSIISAVLWARFGLVALCMLPFAFARRRSADQDTFARRSTVRALTTNTKPKQYNPALNSQAGTKRYNSS
jgi:hypothetical protein